MTFVVHQSQIKTWRRCKRQYYYSYVLKLERKRRPYPLMRGTAVHRMIELKARGFDPWKGMEELKNQYAKLWEQEQEYYGDVVGEITDIMTGYFRWYERDPLTPSRKKKGLNELIVEHKFHVPLTSAIAMAGTADMVAHDSNRRNWLVDHKTHKQIPRSDLKYSDLQSAIYVPALRYELGIKIEGVAWNYIRWKRPTRPQLLKNGEMSRRDIDTTWEIYKDELLKNKLDPDDYEDMKEKLDGKEGEFFLRQYLPVNETLVENLLEEARTTAREMKRKGGHDRTRTIDKHCEWCEFFNLCQAQLRGLDDDFIMKHDFQEKRHGDLPQTESE